LVFTSKIQGRLRATLMLLYVRCVHRLHYRPWWSRRWFYSALHTLDLPALIAAPADRSMPIACGFPADRAMSADRSLTRSVDN